MLLLITSYFSASLQTLCGFIFISFLHKKPLGMQTLFDQALILGTKYITLTLWNFVVICTLGTLKHDWPEQFAKTYSYLYICSVVNGMFVYLWIPIVRYVSIKWPIALDGVPDKKVIRFIQMTSLTLAFICSGLEFTFITDIETTIWFNGLVGKPIEDSQNSKSALWISALVGFAFILLQIYMH